jgi:phthalate 3,4-dioxygenase ferredoxin reductase subunit
VSRAVIVGASVAGVRAAQALRREGWTGDVVLIGDERDLPYDKPPLSKSVLAGTKTLNEVRLVSFAQVDELAITLRLGVAALELDVSNQEVRLADRTAICYDHVVLATGTRARPSPFGSLTGLHVLRSAADCAALGADLSRAASVVVIGAGFIGSEVAATAVRRGVSVTMVDPLPLPMARIVGREVAALLAAVHEPHGVATRFGVGVNAVSERGTQLAVALTDGTEVVADVAVVGIGAVPNVEWLADSGLTIDDGIVCDEYCRAAGQTNVYAAGDVARWWHAREGLHRRVEHWTHAGEQAAAVAHNICHPDDLRAYDPVDYVWSDQYDWRIQIAGRTGEGCTADIIGGVSDGRFAALYGDETGAFTGAVTVNWPKAMVIARRLLVSGYADFDEARAAVADVSARAQAATRG